MKRSLSAAELLALPVRLRGITLGRPADLLLERGPFRVVGLDVDCRDGTRRFLPVPALSIAGAAIELETPFYLLSDDEAAFYRRRARPFSQLRGTAVERGPHRVGTLADLSVASDGTVTALVVDAASGLLELPPDDGVSLAGRPLRAA